MSTLILGFSKIAYVDENLKALELYKKWTPEIEAKCNEFLPAGPQPSIDYRTFTPKKTRRELAVLRK